MSYACIYGQLFLGRQMMTVAPLAAVTSILIMDSTTSILLDILDCQLSGNIIYIGYFASFLAKSRNSLYHLVIKDKQVSRAGTLRHDKPPLSISIPTLELSVND